MMKKCLKPKRDSSPQKQPERKTQQRKETLRVQKFNNRSVKVVTRLRELENARNRIIRQFIPEIRNCRHKIAMSDYFTDEEALTSYIADFMKHFQSTHLKKGAISRCASWQSSLEATTKEILEKREKQAIE